MKAESLSEKFVRDYWNKQAIKDVKEAVKKFGIGCSEAFDSDDLEIVEKLIIKHFGGALV